MFVHRSNRLEELVGVLAEVVGQTAGGALEPEHIVVQSKGMERWLGMELSRRLGVWSNPAFPFPRALVEQLFDAVLGDAGGERFSREALAWAVSALLPGLGRDPAFAPVESYLHGDRQELRRVQLSQRIAYLFDQYAVFRPGMVQEWERGGGEGWQPQLWRALVERLGPGHVAFRAERFLAAWDALGELPRGVPSRISVFGVSTLPPIYVRLLAAVAGRVELHLFLLSPSREYWAEIRSEREVLRALGRGAGPGRDELHLDQGNPLLASLGRAGRDFQRVLESLDDYQEPERDLYRDPGTGGMLAALQSDVLALRRRSPGAAVPPLALRDGSIAVHACHSAMREVEVLRDQLVDMFESDPSLEPRDVIVMMPDIEAYAPLVDAVFGDTASGRGRIPYRIADRTRRSGSAVTEAFLSLLAFSQGRARASEVLDLLQLEPIRARFGIEAAQLAELSHWVHDAGVRWGVDADDRAQAGQPPYEENTWRFGLERLLLGYAMSGEDLFAGVLPFDDMEGGDVELLGQLAELAERLFSWRKRLARPRSPAEWQIALGRLLDDLVAVRDHEVWQLAVVRDTLASLADAACAAGFDERVPLEVMCALLEQAFGEERTTHDFLAGGVTFCALLPMRSIPFRVVCLLGMNDGDFPRANRRWSLDLMAAEPLVGDRNPREEDRYLFLEALLSARERLLVSYAGRGIQDNGVRPPSVVVGELLDAMAGSFGIDRDEFVLVHPLQPFSPRYFRAGGDPRLFSYSTDGSERARALVAQRRDVPPFQRVLLPAVDREQLGVDIGELARFFENPARGLLQRRLGLVLERESVLVEDREPIELDHLELHRIGSTLLERALDGGSLEDGFERTRAAGALPAGTPGRLVYAAVERQALGVALGAHRFREGGRLPPLEVDLRIGSTRVGGALGELWQRAQLAVQYSKLKSRQRLSTWVRHLALQLVAPDGYPRRSVVVARGADGCADVFELAPVEAQRARELLAGLVDLYWLGQRAALWLFPEASSSYVAELLRSAGKPDAADRAERRARSVFGDRSGGAEADNAYVSRAFDGYDALAPALPFAAELGLPGFAGLARRVFEPMLEFERKGDG